MRLFARALPLALAVGMLAGCSGSSRPPTRPAQSPSAAPSLSASAELAARARVGDAALYTARYQLRHPHGGLFGTATIYRSNLGIRIDITESGSTALAIVTHGTSYSCLVVRRHATCFVSARAGHPPPAFLDPGLENVFTRFLATLSSQSADYDVSEAGTTPAAGSVPAGTCFSIVPPTTRSRTVVTRGLYCLTPTGVITRVRYASGELDLISLGGPPRAAQLRPLASPTPLP